MRKILFSSFVLLFFSAAMLIFQASCKKEALAESPNPGLNIILYTLGQKAGADIQVWTAKRDGTNKKQVSLTVPTGSTFTGDVTLSVDGRIYYVVSRPTSMGWHDEIWSVAHDGSNPIKVLDNVGSNHLDLQLKGVF